MSKRNPVIYTIENQQYKLEYMPEDGHFNIDSVTYPDSPEISFNIRVTHRILSLGPDNGHISNAHVIGFLAFRQDSKNWLAYDNLWNYVLEQPKLLLSFAALCEIAHHDLPRGRWE